MEHVTCMNTPDAVPGSVVRASDSVPPVRVSIALMHTVTTPSVSFTVYMTGSNPTRITSINHSHYFRHTYQLPSRVYLSNFPANRNLYDTDIITLNQTYILTKDM